MDEQAKEPRGSECHPIIGWIGSYDPTGNGADFDGGRNWEISRNREETSNDMRCWLMRRALNKSANHDNGMMRPAHVAGAYLMDGSRCIQER